MLGKGADLFLKIGEGYDHADEDIGKLESKPKGGGFWANPPKVSDLKSGGGGWLGGKASKIINTNTNPGNSFGTGGKSRKPTSLNTNTGGFGIKQSSKDRKPIPEYIKEAARKRAKHRCENQDCRVSDREVKVEFHHKNGDRNDNRLENIEYLCPNCHSIK